MKAVVWGACLGLGLLCASCSPSAAVPARSARQVRATAPAIPRIEVPAQWSELAHWEVFQADDDTRLQRLAEQALAAGDTQTASEALRTRLARGRARHAADALGRPDAEAGRAALDEALTALREQVIASALALDDRGLVLAAAEPLQGLSEATLARVRSVLEKYPYVAPSLRSEALARWGEDPRFALAFMQEEQADKLGLDQLSALGDDGLRELNRRLLAAARAGERRRVQALASAVLRLDPLHLEALLSLVLERDLAGGKGRLGSTTRADVLGLQSSYGGHALARLHELSRTTPRLEPAYRLGYARAALEADLPGDCQLALSSLRPRDHKRKHVATAAALLSSLCSLKADDGPPFEAWMTQVQPEASAWLVNRLLHLPTSEKLPLFDRWRGWAERRRLERGGDGLWRSSLLRLWYEAQSEPALRQSAHARLRDQIEAPLLLQYCRKQKLDLDACDQLLEAHSSLDDPEEATLGYDAALPLLAKARRQLPGYRLPWRALGYAYPKKLQRHVVAQLALEGRELRAPGQLVASVVALLHAGRLAEAEQSLQEGAALLSLSDRVMLRLAVRSIEAGAEAEQVIHQAYARYPFVGAGDVEPSTLDAKQRKHIEQKLFPQTHVQALFLRAHQLYREGALQEAIAAFKGVLDALPESERFVVEANIAMAYFNLGKPKRATQWMKRAAAGGGAHDFVHELSGRIHEAAGRSEQARLSYVTALRIEPVSRVALHGLVRLSAAGAVSFGRLRELLATLAPASPLASTLNERVQALKVPDAAVLAALDGPYDDKTFELGEQGYRDENLDYKARRFIDAKLRATEAPEQVRHWASRAVAYHEKGDSGDPAEAARWAWYYFLAGQPARAASLVRADDPEGSDGHPLVTLQEARENGSLADAQAALLFRELQHFRQAPLQAVEALQGLGKRDLGVAHYLCRLLVDAELGEAARQLCATAWLGGRRGPDLAAAVSWLVRTAADAANSVGLSEDAVFAIRGRAASALGPDWLFNKASLRFEQKRDDEGLALVELAWRQGFALRDYGLPVDDLRGMELGDSLSARYLVAVSEQTRGTRMATIAALSFNAIDPGLMRYYGRAAARIGGLEPSLAAILPSLIDLADLLEDDLRLGRIRRHDAHFVVGAVQRQDAEQLAELGKRFPESALVQFCHAETLLLARDAAAGRPLALALLERYPNNGGVLQLAISGHMLADDRDKARRLVHHAAALFPDDTRFSALSSMFAKAGGTLPETIGTLAALQRAEVGALAALAEKGAQRHASRELELELFVPSGYQAALGEELHFTTEDGVMLKLGRMPRATRCEPQRCLEVFVKEFERLGMKTRFTAARELPLGRAGFALLDSGARVALLWAVPLERQVYVATVAGPAEQVAARIGELQAAVQTLRWLGSALPAARAEALRERLWSLPPAATLIAARAEQATRAGKSGCPLRQTLAALDNDTARAALLADIWLSSQDTEARRALTRCATTGDDAAAKLALLALLEEDDDLHRYGQAAVRHFPKSALQDARTMIGEGYRVPSGRASEARRDLAPYGALEILLALPDKERRQLCRDLLQNTDKELHLLGLSAAIFDPGIAPLQILQADVRSAPTGTALLAVHAARAADDQRSLPAIRDRLAQLGPPVDAGELALIKALASTLAAALDAEDEPRLQQAIARVAGQEYFAAQAVEALEALLATHRLARSMREGKQSLPQDGADWAVARSWSSHSSARRKPSGKSPRVVSESELYERTLPELLPAVPTRYARVASPAKPLQRLQELLARLDFGDESDAFLLRMYLGNMTARSGLDLLSPAGGLDLARPIECAGPHGGSSFVCTAYVSQPARVRSLLGQRAVGSDAGVALLLHLLEASASLPDDIASVPALIHRLLFPRLGGGGGGGAKLLAERLRTSEWLHGYRLDRYASLELHEGHGVLIDHEHYLLVRDKLFVFGGERMVDAVLGGLGADKPLSSWAGFAAMQRPRGKYEALRGGQFFFEGAQQRAATLTLGLARDGGRYAWHVPAAARVEKDLASLVAALPAGGSLSFASLDHDALASTRGHLRAAYPARSLGTPPPDWLLSQRARVAIAFFGEEGGALWSRWALSLPMTPAVLAALGDRGIALQGDRPAQHDQLWFLRRGDVLVVASQQELLRRTPAGKSEQVLHLKADGEKLSVALRSAIDGIESDEAERTGSRLIANLFKGLDEIEVRGRRDAGGYTLQTQWKARTRARSRAPLSPVKQWLAVKNSVALPGSFEQAPSSQPLVYRVRVEDAAALVRRKPARGSRLNIAARDATTLELRVAATDPSAQGPLDAELRERLLAGSSRIQLRSPELQQLVKRITAKVAPGDVSATAERIVQWVHSEMSYEVTPEAVGTSELISRMRGDCSEYSLLTVALLRASGIPAGLMQGLLAADQSLVAHAWVRYYDGERFREVDPTNASEPVGSHHIPIAVDDVLGLLSLGGFEVTQVTPADVGAAPRKVEEQSAP